MYGVDGCWTWRIICIKPSCIKANCCFCVKLAHSPRMLLFEYDFLITHIRKWVMVEKVKIKNKNKIHCGQTIDLKKCLFKIKCFLLITTYGMDRSSLISWISVSSWYCILSREYTLLILYIIYYILILWKRLPCDGLNLDATEVPSVAVGNQSQQTFRGSVVGRCSF